MYRLSILLYGYELNNSEKVGIVLVSLNLPISNREDVVSITHDPKILRRI